jgi:hypothetical protein
VLTLINEMDDEHIEEGKGVRSEPRSGGSFLKYHDH